MTPPPEISATTSPASHCSAGTARASSPSSASRRSQSKYSSTATWLTCGANQIAVSLVACRPCRLSIYTKRIEVRWRDMDAFKHVNNSVYLTYLEEARDEWFVEVLGSGLLLNDFVLARCAVDYRSPLRQDDGHVDVELRCTRVGRSSVDMGSAWSSRRRRPLWPRGRGGRRALRLEDGPLPSADRRDPHRVHALAVRLTGIQGRLRPRR